jgi:hypothetical protein
MVPTCVLVGSPKAKCNTNNQKIAPHKKNKNKKSHIKDFKGVEKKKFIKKGGNCRTQNPQ